MIEIRVPKEITAYKEKLLFGLTARQTIASVVALGINVPLYFWGKDILGSEAMSWIVIFIALPIVFLGYFKYNEMVFEKFLVAVIQAEFIYPRKRIYQMENYLDNIQRFEEKNKTQKSKKSRKNKVSKKEEVE